MLQVAFSKITWYDSMPAKCQSSEPWTKNFWKQHIVFDTKNLTLITALNLKPNPNGSFRQIVPPQV